MQNIQNGAIPFVLIQNNMVQTGLSHHGSQWFSKFGLSGILCIENVFLKAQLQCPTGLKLNSTDYDWPRLASLVQLDQVLSLITAPPSMWSGLRFLPTEPNWKCPQIKKFLASRRFLKISESPTTGWVQLSSVGRCDQVKNYKQLVVTQFKEIDQ